MKKCLAWAMALVMLVSSAFAFSDVEKGSWYEGAVCEMAEAGILTGLPDGSFHPYDTITAAELVTIAARCAGQQAPLGQRHWASHAMDYALGQGWYDWDELPPTGEGYDLPISRQLAVKILMKALLPEVKGDYAVQSAKIRDFSALNGRYYEPVLAAYEAGIAVGDGEGCFRPADGLTRAEACVLFQRALGKAAGTEPAPPVPVTPVPEPHPAAAGGVSANGWLQVKEGGLCNEAGEPVLLRGMSTHGLQWFPQYASPQSIANTAAYGANVFRVAMYTGEGGYLSQPQAMEERLTQAVDAAIGLDLYAIIDWHILSDGDPMAHVEEAEAFFARMGERYGDTPNVLFEICNEPNGNVTWAGNVKPYAQRVVGAIREKGADNIILIGSPTWSQDIHLAAADPVEGENLMYTLHFYAGTHGQWLRDRAAQALAQGLPLFVTEWGTSRADGSGGVYLEEAAVWLDFLEANGVSWCNWSLCDKNETSAALRPGTAADKPWGEGDLTPSGAFVMNRLG